MASSRYAHMAAGSAPTPKVASFSTSMSGLDMYATYLRVWLPPAMSVSAPFEVLGDVWPSPPPVISAARAVPVVVRSVDAAATPVPPKSVRREISGTVLPLPCRPFLRGLAADVTATSSP